MEQTKLIKTVV